MNQADPRLAKQSLEYRQPKLPEHIPELAIVVPTYNECGNVRPLVERLTAVLAHLRWEIVFVDDDSPDHTSRAIEQIIQTTAQVRLLRRIGRRGLSSACIEGMLATTAPILAVMDADLQHDETILPNMYELLIERSLDLVVATRNSQGGSMGSMGRTRLHVSRAGQLLSSSVSKCNLSDPMSGYFLVTRTFLDGSVRQMRSGGFKVLLDLLASSPKPANLCEVGYTFRERGWGKSKLDINAGLALFISIFSNITKNVFPDRFLLFAMVGSVGVLTHMLILEGGIRVLSLSFLQAQTAGTFVAAAENFYLNNLITFRDRRLFGGRFALGLLVFWLGCSFGAWANVLFSRDLIRLGWPWLLAGAAGLVLSAVWNYGISILFAWKRQL